MARHKIQSSNDHDEGNSADGDTLHSLALRKVKETSDGNRKGYTADEKQIHEDMTWKKTNYSSIKTYACF